MLLVAIYLIILNVIAKFVTMPFFFVTLVRLLVLHFSLLPLSMANGFWIKTKNQKTILVLPSPTICLIYSSRIHFPSFPSFPSSSLLAALFSHFALWCADSRKIVLQN